MPSRYMRPFGPRMLTGRDPFQVFQREIGRMLDDTFRSFGENVNAIGGKVAVPPVDVHEQDGELYVTADIPGVREDDIDVRVEGDLLTIRGDRREQNERKGRGYHVVERASGSFHRTMRLPFAPDPESVTAEYADGVLAIRLPKKAGAELSRKIELKRGGAAIGGLQAGENGVQGSDPTQLSGEDHVVPGAGMDHET